MRKKPRIILRDGTELKLPDRIKTVYMFQREIVRTTYGRDLFQSVPVCIGHMQINDYGADFAEVLDADTEQLYATVAMPIGEQPVPTWYWNPEDTNRKYAISPLLKRRKAYHG